MKTCSNCESSKDETLFNKDRRSSDGLCGYCRTCVSSYQRSRRAANLEKVRSDDRMRYALNPEKKLASAKALYAADPAKYREIRRKQRAANPERTRGYKWKHNYGLTVLQFNTMLAEQGNACAICRKNFTETGHVDHCHQTKKVRGILCQDCNLGLGRFKDSSAVAQLAVNYLKKHGK